MKNKKTKTKEQTKTIFDKAREREIERLGEIKNKEYDIVKWIKGEYL